MPLSPSAFRDWLAVLASTGARALIAIDRPAYANQVPWTDLPVSTVHSSTILGVEAHRYSVFLLPLNH